MSMDSKGLSVMVVEDSRVTMAALHKWLGKIGIGQVFTAVNGKEAIDIFRRDHPDIILLDGLLPDIDGFEVARQMREIEGGKSWSAIIFLTGMDNDEDLARGIQAGGDDYLKKPITSIVLNAKINAMRRLVEIQRANMDIKNQLNEAMRLLEIANKKLLSHSTIDELTGISNRRMLDECLAKEWSRCERLKMPVSLVLMDIDLFKEYIDNYGNQGGDECLKQVAAQMARSVGRPGDLAARYGGETFALVLGFTDKEAARLIADRARKLVFDLKMKHEGSATQQVTISCGVAAMIPDDTCAIEDLVKAADEALTQAKSQGRNKVICAGSRFLDDFHEIIPS